MATHRLKLVPLNTNIDFVGLRLWAFTIASGLTLLSLVGLFLFGLNFGVDFRGGILLEARTDGPADVASMRGFASNLGLGEVGLQQFGGDRDVLLRIAHQPGGELEQTAAAEKVRVAFTEAYPGIQFRRAEVVGPQVSRELVVNGFLAVCLAVAAMMIYVWFRFEWQFGVGAVLALTAVAMTTLGMFAWLQLEFSLPIIAAILTIIGYSMNDTVVIYDRIRENLRKYRSLELVDLINRSINSTLARSVNTHFTTFLATLALYLFGGEALHGFTLAMIWGVVTGAMSSVFIAAPVLLYLEVNRGSLQRASDAQVAQQPAH
ncbi:MAG: protein translocase subunit SecF [Alphaproteobacteria bacterium]|nr:protein translocase subunit SecF [Alphaproteobacteria bacterium]